MSGRSFFIIGSDRFRRALLLPFPAPSLSAALRSRFLLHRHHLSGHSPFPPPLHLQPVLSRSLSQCPQPPRRTERVPRAGHHTSPTTRLAIASALISTADGGRSTLRESGCSRSTPRASCSRTEPAGATRVALTSPHSIRLRAIGSRSTSYAVPPFPRRPARPPRRAWSSERRVRASAADR